MGRVRAPRACYRPGLGVWVRVCSLPSQPERSQRSLSGDGRTEQPCWPGRSRLAGLSWCGDPEGRRKMESWGRELSLPVHLPSPSGLHPASQPAPPSLPQAQAATVSAL